ncbi:hypothetical protein thsrh120_31940 [Rhizobium sp. No.120]
MESIGSSHCFWTTEAIKQTYHIESCSFVGDRNGGREMEYHDTGRPAGNGQARWL